jgi:hypothetical protein
VVRQGEPWAVDWQRTVPLRELLCLLSLDTQRLAANARAPPPLMKRPMIVLGAPPTRERQPRAAEVDSAVVARAPAHAACFVAHSSDDVGQFKRLKDDVCVGAWRSFRVLASLAARKVHTRTTAPTQQRRRRDLLPRQPRAADARGT